MGVQQGQQCLQRTTWLPARPGLLLTNSPCFTVLRRAKHQTRGAVYEQILKKNEQARCAVLRCARYMAVGFACTKQPRSGPVACPMVYCCNRARLSLSHPPSPEPQMYALLAVVTALCPTANRLLDEAVTNTLREK